MAIKLVQQVLLKKLVVRNSCSDLTEMIDLSFQLQF